ncbi:hypothetical protein [Stenotrophomonas maltophilia group sp. LNF259]
MASRLTFGIDPGLTGAIVTLLDGEPGPMVDMPVMDGEVDARAVAAFLRQQRDAHPGAVIAVALERIHARPMRNDEGKAIEGSVARHNLAEGFGQLKATVRLLGLHLVLVQPSVWKRRFDLSGKSKDAGRVLAIQRFPAAATQLQRKKDNGRADALLIGLYGDSLIRGGA